MAEKSLPKPELDLPLPEKELPSGEEEKSEPEIQETGLPIVKEEKSHGGISLLGSFIFGFLFVVLIVLVGGGAFLLGKTSVFKDTNPGTPSIPPTTESKKDPTADWKTYEGNGFTFKYPQGWLSGEGCVYDTKCLKYVLVQSYPYPTTGPDKPTNANGEIINFYIYPNPLKLTTAEFVNSPLGLNHDSAPKIYQPNKEEKIGENKYLTETTLNYDSSETVNYYIQSPNTKNVIWIFGMIIAKNFDYDKMSPQEHNSYIKILNDVLSSFKFTDSTATLTPAPTGTMVACTMEAKLCPDEKTYVSRQGPNCEFSKCPTSN